MRSAPHGMVERRMKVICLPVHIEIAWKLAVSNSVESIAFPNISTGIYKFPKKAAAEIVIREVEDFLRNDTTIQKLIFCCFE